MLRASLRKLLSLRLAAVLLLIGVAALALGARCIERTSVWVDPEGYTHISGTMVNETDIHGAQLLLRGTLYDGAGNVIATKDSPPCPPDLKARSEVTFDIRFDNPGIPPHARYDVRPISGLAFDQAKPNPDVLLFMSEAVRLRNIPFAPGILPFDENDVLFGFRVRNRTNNTYPIQGCAAVYDQAGNVVYSISSEIVQFDENFNVSPAQLLPQELTFVTMIADDVPRGPIQVKAWLWFGRKGDTTSQWQYVNTGMISIVTQDF